MSDAWHRFADVRRARRGAAGRPARAPRLPHRPRRRGGRRLRRAVPERGEQGRRARLPGLIPLRARRDRARSAGRRVLAALREDTPADADAVGRRGPPAPADRGRGVRRRARPRGRRARSPAPATSCRRTRATLIGATIADWLTDLRRLSASLACLLGAPAAAAPAGAGLVGARGRCGRRAHDVVGAHGARRSASRSAPRQRARRADDQRAGRARHEDVEARELERGDDLVGDLLGRDALDAAQVRDAGGQLGARRSPASRP